MPNFLYVRVHVQLNKMSHSSTAATLQKIELVQNAIETKVPIYHSAITQVAVAIYMYIGVSIGGSFPVKTIIIFAWNSLGTNS